MVMEKQGGFDGSLGRGSTSSRRSTQHSGGWVGGVFDEDVALMSTPVLRDVHGDCGVACRITMFPDTRSRQTTFAMSPHLMGSQRAKPAILFQARHVQPSGDPGRVWGRLCGSRGFGSLSRDQSPNPQEQTTVHRSTPIWPCLP
jgi:hypothetical protein